MNSLTWYALLILLYVSAFTPLQMSELYGQIDQVMTKCNNLKRRPGQKERAEQKE